MEKCYDVVGDVFFNVEATYIKVNKFETFRTKISPNPIQLE